jgi:hypothetical protein
MATTAARKLERKNFIVDARKVKALRRVLEVRSESEAVRRAVDRVLDSAEAIAALERLRKRGTLGANLA